MRKVIPLLAIVFCIIVFASTDWKQVKHYLFEGNIQDVQNEHLHPREEAILIMSGERQDEDY